MSQEISEGIESAQGSDRLNWIVPCRRAVVTGEVNYSVTIEAWVHQLYSNRNPIMRWYFPRESGGRSDPLPPSAMMRQRASQVSQYYRGLYAIQHWKSRFFPQSGTAPPQSSSEPPGTPVPVAPNEGASVNTQSVREFFVRLWKGPQRVLRERPGGLNEPQFNSLKEITDPGMTFVAGDVIEFPMHKYLVNCGEQNFSDVEFDPDGSFLQGTSLRQGSESSPYTIGIHDNLLSMKFQLLLDLAVGSYYRLGGVRGVGFTANVDGHAISSRGMIYGGSFGNPTVSHLSNNHEYWGIHTNGWGRGTSGPLRHPYNLPARSDINSSAWNATDLLTTGWACSPCAIFLVNYMLDNWSPYGAGEVRSIMKGTAHHPMQDFLEIQYDSTRSDPLPDRSMVEASDLSVISKNGHELSVVRLHAPNRLLREVDLPIHGFLSVYNPLNGEPCVINPEDPEEDASEIYRFEASAGLGRWRYQQSAGHVYSIFGLRRFRWERIGPGGTIYPSSLLTVFTVQGTDRTLEQNQDLTRSLKPIVIHLHRNGYQSLYSDRAVPYPTLDEASGRHETINNVITRVNTARTRVQQLDAGTLAAHVTPGSPPSAQNPTDTYRSLLGL
jgi:hypothetical protein